MHSQQPEDANAVPSQKAIVDLLCVHNAIIRAWYEDWVREQTARVNLAFDARQSRPNKESLTLSQ